MHIFLFNSVIKAEFSNLFFKKTTFSDHDIRQTIPVAGASDSVCVLSAVGHLFHVITAVLFKLVITESTFCH